MPLLKKAVDPSDVTPPIWYAIGYADALKRELFDRSQVVTALRDGQHMKGSLHQEGKAVDLRTNDLLPTSVRILFNKLRKNLDPQGFDTVLETDHIHVEFDPKEGEEFLKEE